MQVEEDAEYPGVSKVVSTWKDIDGSSVLCRTENLVFTCNIHTTLNLIEVSNRFKKLGAQFNRKRFAAVIVRYKNPTIATLLFQPGNMVITGAKNIYQAQFVVRDIVGKLVEIGYRDAHIIGGLKIQNLVESVTLPWLVNLAGLALQHSAYCSYEPELFPGVIIRFPPIRPMTVLVFTSGKMVITGAKSKSDVFNALSNVVTLIRPHAQNKITGKNRFLKPNAVINNMVRLEKGNKRELLPDVAIKQQPPLKKIKIEPGLVEKKPIVPVVRNIGKEEEEPEPVIQHMPNLGDLANFAKLSALYIKRV